jgi:PAS domain S-box-containing protein
MDARDHAFEESQTLVQRLPSRFRLVSRMCSQAAVLAGGVVLVGWWKGISELTSVLPGLASMKPNTALSFCLAGLSLWFCRSAQSAPPAKRITLGWVSSLFAGVVALITAGTAIEHLSGWNFYFDEILFPATLRATGVAHPGRMSFASASGLLLIAVALLLLTVPGSDRRVASQAVSLVAGLIGFVGFLAYLYGVPLLGGFDVYSTMAVHTSALVLILSLGTVLARPDSGFIAEIAGGGPGGIVARRLLPVVIGLPILMGSAWLYGSRLGFYDLEFASALTGISAVVLLCFLVLQSARRLNRLDEKRRQAEERNLFLAAIVNCSNDAIIGRTVDGAITSWNKAAERLFGYREDEVVGKTFNLLIPPDRQPEGREMLAANRQGRAIERFETMRIHKEGRLIPVSLTHSPVVDADGRVIGGATLAYDISERERNEALLRESRNQMEALIDSAMDAVVIVNSRQEIVLFNSAAEKMFGRTADEVRGRSLSRLIPPQYQTAHAEHVRNFGQSGVTRRAMGALTTVQGLRANGESFPIEASIAHFQSGDQKLFAAIVRDVSERQRTEEALQLAQDQLLSALEAGSMGTWSWEIPDNIVTWSEPLLRLFGINAESVKDGRLEASLSFVHPADRDGVQEALQAAARDNAGYEVEFRSNRPDAALQWIAARGRLERDPQGQPLRLTGVCVDITARKRMEDSLLQAHKMEALGTLAGGVAHDFNNILMVIAGNTELAVADLPADHPAQKPLATIEKASLRAANLVHQILTFSRRQAPARLVISLQPEVEEAVKLLRATLPARVEIRAEYAPGAINVSADPTQVHQILMNLGTNAAHAMGESSGVLEIRLEDVTLSADQANVAAGLSAGRYARLVFKDNGCGMDRATRDRIFEPFFTTKGVGKGTGLGLSVVHGIMKNHGGAVSVYSEVGKGTIFHLYFPAADQALEAAGAAPSSPTEIPQGNGERILSVDDEEALVLVTKRQLEKMGYIVTACSDPRQALEIFRARPLEFDALLTDVSMPHLPGAELVQAIRQIRPDVPVVMASGYLRPEDQAAAEQLGIRELISKPYNVAELARVLQRLFAEALAAPKP